MDHEKLNELIGDWCDVFRVVLWRFFYHQGLGPEAEDLTQEVFARVGIRIARTGVVPSNPRTYLLACANNLFRDVLRRRPRQEGRRIPLDEIADPAADPADEPLVRLAKEERSQQVRAALARLPERDRRLAECLMQGLTREEMAARLLCNERTVYRRLPVVCEQLRGYLAVMHADCHRHAAISPRAVIQLHGRNQLA